MENNEQLHTAAGGDATSVPVQPVETSTKPESAPECSTDGNEVQSVVPVDDPLAPDAPIHHLLSIRHNPLVANMTTDELRELVQRLRTYATSAPSLSSKLATDSANVSPRTRKSNTKAAQRKAILADL
jgi:hypothetical protein